MSDSLIKYSPDGPVFKALAAVVDEVVEVECPLSAIASAVFTLHVQTLSDLNPTDAQIEALLQRTKEHIVRLRDSDVASYR